MSDPIQISMYIQSLGLSGKEAETKRAELEKLSDAELTALITGKSSQTFAPYDFSKAVFEFTPTSLTTGISVEKQSAPQAQEKKKYSAYEKTQLRNFASQYLLDSASNAYSAIDDYNKSVGIISTDAVVNGFKIFTGQEDRHALQERLGEELKQAEDLNSTLSRPGAFESKFERTRGVLYNPENIDNLKQKSEEYLEISAYQEKYNILSQGIKDIKKIIREEQEYNQTRKYVSGPAAASLTPPETSSHEKFGEVLLQLCNGDKELVNQYMQQITAKMGSRAEIEKNMPQILEELQTNFKAEYDKKLAGKSFEQYTKEYESAYSKALGGKNPEFATQNFIEKAKTQSAYTEMGLIIASSLLLPGSSTVAKGTAALARNVGTKAAGHIVKGAMTATMGAAPAGLTALNAVTSEKGFTAETKNEIFEELKSGLMYGGFGAYVSGPLGNAVENLLKTKPEVLGSVVSRVMSNGKTGETVAKVTGVMAETSADVMFDGLTSDMSVLESLQTNGGMNFAMMIAGGRIAKMHQNLQGIKIEQQNNGTYKIKDANDKLILNAKDENALATFILGKGLETETAANNNTGVQGNIETSAPPTLPKGMTANDDAAINRAKTQNPAEVVADKVREQWRQTDVNTKAEDEQVDLFNLNQTAGLNQPAPRVNDEVTNLILTDKIKEKLTQRYEEMGKVFSDIAKDRSADLKQLSQECGNDNQAFANGVVKILAEEMGLQGLEPKIELIDTTGQADGFADWTTGTIQINKDTTNAKKLVEIISHEFVHMLQYRDILAQYGEQGLREVIMNNRGLAGADASVVESEITKVLNSDYTRKLLENFNELKHAEKGSINEYITRIYKDEFVNNISPNEDMKAYTNQVTEREAYYAGSEQLGNNTEGLEDLTIGKNAQNNNSLKAVLLKKRQQLLNGETVVRKNTLREQISDKANSDVDEFGQIHRKLPAGIELPMGKLGTEQHGLATKLKIVWKKQKIIHSLNGKPNEQELKFIDGVLNKNPDIDIDAIKSVIYTVGSFSPDMIDTSVLLTTKFTNQNYWVLQEILSNTYKRNSKPYIDFLQKAAESNLTDTQLCALLARDTDFKKIRLGILIDNTSCFKILENFLPELSKLKEDQLSYIVNIIECSLDINKFNDTSNSLKTEMLKSIQSLPSDIKKTFIQEGIRIDNLEAKLKVQSNLKGYEVNVDKDSQNRFLSTIIANNTPKTEEILTNNDAVEFFEQNKGGLPLEYSRVQFVHDLNKLLQELSVEEKQKVLDDLDITLSSTDFNGFIKFNNLDENNYSSASKNVISEIQNIAQKFTKENGVTCSNPELKSVLDDLIQGFPEFTSIIGKQNGSQDKAIDVHTLEVLSNALSSPEYKNLSDKDKTVLKFAILMHDFGKMSYSQDDYAPLSAVYTNSILDKFKLPADIKERIVNLVKNQNFNKTSPEHFNWFFRTKEDEAIAKIMVQADYKSTTGTTIDLSEFKTNWYQHSAPVVNPVNPQKYFPKTSFVVDGKTVEIPVLNLNELAPDTDMGAYGYTKGSQIKDIIVQVHNAKSPEKLEEIFKLYEDPNNDYTLSTSIKNIKNSNNGYGSYGVTLRTQAMNRGGGNRRDYSEIRDFNKGMDSFMYESLRSQKRGDVDYLADYFNTIQYPTQIKDTEINGVHYTKEELLERYYKIQESFEPNSPYLNELFAFRPRISEIVVHGNFKTEQLPPEIIKLADKYGVAIIITGS